MNADLFPLLLFYLKMTYFYQYEVVGYCFQLLSSSSVTSLVKGLPEALQRQYDYEDPIVRSGKHLMHSPFFKVCITIRLLKENIHEQ